VNKLTPEQIQRLRKPFDKLGAFDECTDEQVEYTLNSVMAYYVTLGSINLRITREKYGKQ